MASLNGRPAAALTTTAITRAFASPMCLSGDGDQPVSGV